MKGNLRALFRKFCLEGSVSGLKYLYLFPDKVSRCYWIAFILLALYFATCLAALLYQRFIAMPTRITIENQFEPVAPLPFPAITLCTPNQLTISAVKHFDETLVNGNRSAELTDIMHQILGFYHFIVINNDELAYIQELIDLNRYTVAEVLWLLAQPCDRFLRFCSFRHHAYPHCRGLFHPVLTKHGVCCVFNSPYRISKGRSRNERDPKFEPRLVQKSGTTDGLMVMTDYEPADAIDNTIQFAGATRVMFTDWTEFPSDDESQLVAPNTESFHFIHATATYCSSDVQDMTFENRKCLFEDERHLPFFMKYRNSDCDLMCLATAVEEHCDRKCLFEDERHLPFFLKYRNSDCDLMCLATAVEEHCECLLPYLPRLPTTRTCHLTAIQCITETKLSLADYVKKSQCECPRDCDSRQYRVDSTVGNFDGLQYLVKPFFRGRFTVNKSSTLMHFGFPSPVYQKQKQETVMSVTTLFSNLGGVFGLCLGCSVISVVEIWFFYYSAVKNCARARINRRRERRVQHTGFYLE